jgi:acetylornithine deacetylase/succinyl-diaminopimelate desuccinylase-like protein
MSILAQLEKDFDEHFRDLQELARIPSISFAGFPPEEVARSAEKVAALCRKAGLENVEILRIDGAHPYVVADWLHAGPGAPTLLLYAHHDVQPPGRAELWKTPPFEPTLKEGPGGTRLYGRGTADDKAGALIHLSAIASYLRAEKRLPVNVKLVIEGEEETGSESLPRFLEQYRERLQADVMVLTDTTNFDCGVPALTVALRGLVGVEVEVRALTKSVHSGMWGGPVPDPVMALCKALSGMVDSEGRIALPEVRAQVRPLSSAEEKSMREIPFEEAAFREQCGMVPGARLLREGPNPNAQIWRFPSLTVTAIQASSRAAPANIINDVAWAKVTIRTAPDLDPDTAVRAIERHLRENLPWGLELKLSVESSSGPWAIEPSGWAFEAADAAMKAGYGRAPLKIGCGGSIPFVKPFAQALGGVPALLVGVEDPYTNAHGENESLLVSDFRKACISKVHLFRELAERFSARVECPKVC